MRLKEDISSFWDRFLTWMERHVPEQVMVVVLAVITGIIAGILASFIKHLMSWCSRLVFSDVPPGEGDWRLLVFPVVGIFLAMIYQRYIVHDDVSHGTAKIKSVLRSGGDYRIRGSVIFSSILGCGATVGFGGSAGSEGPLAYSGAAAGSVLGRWCRLSPEWIRVMVGIGAGAGIAGIFKSPIGGTLYTLEVLQLELHTIPIMALLIACVMASVTCFMLSGYAFDWAFIMKAEFDPASLGWMFLLGLFCGLYAVWYLFSRKMSGRLLVSIKNPWLKALLAGAFTAVLVFSLPLLFGEGCTIIGTIINGGELAVFGLGPFHHWMDNHTVFLVLIVVILLVKGPLVAAANYGGGVAGDFVPALYIGGVAGYLFGLLLKEWFGVDIPAWYTALGGMGAVLACSTHAPLMTIFLMCETTNSFQYMPAYLVAITTAYVVMKLCMPNSKADNSDYDSAHALWNGVEFSLDNKPQATAEASTSQDVAPASQKRSQ